MAVAQNGETGTEMIVQTKNIMKTKLDALILLALTLPGSGFALASKPLAERQQEYLSWKFGFMICHLQNHLTERGAGRVSFQFQRCWPPASVSSIVGQKNR